MGKEMWNSELLEHQIFYYDSTEKILYGMTELVLKKFRKGKNIFYILIEMSKSIKRFLEGSV